MELQLSRIATPEKARLQAGFWEGDLGYSASFATCALALSVGVAMHGVIGYGVVWPAIPTLGVIVAWLAAAIIMGRVFRTRRVVAWLSGIPFAVATTVSSLGLAVVGGVLPQRTVQSLGAPSVWASWPFILVTGLMMLNLACSCGKRIWPVNRVNATYIASHFGLLLAVLGGAVGALTLQRRTVVLFQGQGTDIAYDRSEHESRLPFSLKLQKFDMETFPPTLALATRDAGQPGGLRVTPGSAFLKAGVEEKLDGHRVQVLKYHARAVLLGEQVRIVPWVSAAPVAQVEVTTPTGTTKTGWVSCGSIDSPSSMLDIGPTSAVVMPSLRPKKFRSTVTIDEGGTQRTVDIEVNKPVTIAGMTLYQLSYDEKMGAASEYSVLEAVSDRGLPVVYLGMGLMVVGAASHLWNGAGGKR